MNTQQKQAAFWLDYSQHLSTAIRYTEALKAAERAVQLDATNAEAWYVKGTCLAMLAQYEEALADFEQALILDTNYVPAWDGKAWVLGILVQYPLTLQYPLTDRRNEENLTPPPKPPDMGDSNGTMPNLSSGFALGQKTQALAAVNRALELDPDYFEAQKRKKRLEVL